MAVLGLDGAGRGVAPADRLADGGLVNPWAAALFWATVVVGLAAAVAQAWASVEIVRRRRRARRQADALP